MRTILGIATAILSGVLAIYVGLYLMFIRGIIQVVQSITPRVIASGIAIGIVRVIFASLVGWIIFMVGLAMVRIIVN